MTEPSPPSRLSWILRFVEVYAATIVATGSILAALFLVPQTAAIIAQTSLGEAIAYSPRETLIRIAGLAASVLGFVALYGVVFPPDPLVVAPPGATIWAAVQGRAERFHARGRGASNAIAASFLRSLAPWSRPRRLLAGLGVMIVGAVGTVQLAPANVRPVAFGPDYASTWPGLLLVGFGAWTALLPAGHGGDPARVSWGWRVPPRAVLVVGAAWSMGAVLWALPVLFPGSVSTQPYTVWGVGFLVFLAAVIGRCVDAAALRSRWPVRLLAALGALALLGAGRDDRIQRAAPAGGAPTADPDAWFDAMLARLAALPSDGPAVLVAASGGGSRAALFASLTYETLRATPMDPSDPESPSFGSNILAISSVSGGSLASAYYQDRAAGRTDLPAWETAATGPTPLLVGAMHQESKRLAARAVEKLGSGPIPEHFAAVEKDVGGWPAAPIAGAPWLDRSPFVRDMTADFMAAVLRAVIEPGLTRGESITRTWVTTFGLGGLDNLPGRATAGPAVLFNATEVDSGRRYVIGFPRLAPGLLGESAGAMDDGGGARWVDNAEAARLSANFPWGFDVVHLPDPTGGASVDLLDGGIIDNTGIDTFATLFEAVAAAAGEIGAAPSGAPTARETKAVALLDALRARGVVLIEIDAGARPDETSGLAALLPSFTRPLRALSTAGANNAFAARDGNVERIARVLSRDGRAAGFVHLAWICNRIDNVRTAWSLGARDQAATIVQFLAEQRRLAPLLPLVAAEIASPGSELQDRLDRGALETRRFQVAALSHESVESSRLTAVSGQIAVASKVNEQRRSAPEKRRIAPPKPPLPPPPAPEEVTAAAAALLPPGAEAATKEVAGQAARAVERSATQVKSTAAKVEKQAKTAMEAATKKANEEAAKEVKKATSGLESLLPPEPKKK